MVGFQMDFTLFVLFCALFAVIVLLVVTVTRDLMEWAAGRKAARPAETAPAAAGPEAEEPKPESETEPPKPLQIVIKKKTQYEPEWVDQPFSFTGKTPNPRNDGRYYLILRPYAMKKLNQSLDWGTKTTRNQVEQGGILLGRVARYQNEVYNFVEDILLADTAGHPAFVEFTNKIWADMQHRLTQLNMQRETSGQLVIVGWYHTHPNGLSVFMSGTDMGTQRLNFSQDWQVSLVMNPHTNNRGAFFGEKATAGKIVFPEQQETA